MLSAVYLNLSQYPSVYVFSLPLTVGQTPSNEVFADAAGGANWHEAWDLAFTPSSDHIPAGRMNGQNNENGPLLQYHSAAYGLKCALLPQAQFSTAANIAELSFHQFQILAFEHPPIKSSATTDLAPMLRAYMVQGNIDVLINFAVRGVLDSTSVTNSHITDRLLWPIGINAANDGYFWTRDPNMPAAPSSERPTRSVANGFPSWFRRRSSLPDTLRGIIIFGKNPTSTCRTWGRAMKEQVIRDQCILHLTMSAKQKTKFLQKEDMNVRKTGEITGAGFRQGCRASDRARARVVFTCRVREGHGRSQEGQGQFKQEEGCGRVNVAVQKAKADRH